METKGLKKVLARCGCEGCYFDTNPPCDLDNRISEEGKIPDVTEWSCSDETGSYIYVKEGDTNESRV